MLFAPIIAFIQFLYKLNVERIERTSWGDSFLRAFTSAFYYYFIGVAFEIVCVGILLLTGVLK